MPRKPKEGTAPRSLRELVPFLANRPHVSYRAIQGGKHREALCFTDFKDGGFWWSNPGGMARFTAVYSGSQYSETGIRFSRKGFRVERYNVCQEFLYSERDTPEPEALRVLMFSNRFVPLVRAGAKRQTIRFTDRVAPGDTLSLRYWSGKPYRSRHARIIPDRPCLSSVSIAGEIPAEGPAVFLWIGGEGLTAKEVKSFVKADGFGGVEDYAEHYRAKGIREFKGSLYAW